MQFSGQLPPSWLDIWHVISIWHLFWYAIKYSRQNNFSEQQKGCSWFSRDLEGNENRCREQINYLMLSWPILWEDLIIIMWSTKASFWKQGSQKKVICKQQPIQRSSTRLLSPTSKNFRFKIRIRICCCWRFYTYPSVFLAWNPSAQYKTSYATWNFLLSLWLFLFGQFRLFWDTQIIAYSSQFNNFFKKAKLIIWYYTNKTTYCMNYRPLLFSKWDRLKVENCLLGEEKRFSPHFSSSWLRSPHNKKD